VHVITFVTPVVPHHIGLLPQCLDSVQAQTIACYHIYLVDSAHKGAGYTRNRLIETVSTEFIVCLDADDWVEPTFAELTLEQFTQTNKYCYTDWYQDGRVVYAPDCAWINRTAHLVTTLMPTQWAREVGMFDEQLPAAEDTDYHVKLVTSGYCGKRLPIPLVHYRKDGGRGKAVHDNGDIDIILETIRLRYGGKKVGCCGDEAIIDTSPVGQRQDGDVLAQAAWGGNRQEMGRATGRQYPRTSYPHYVWVDPRDAQMRPDHWMVVPPGDPPSPKVKPPPVQEALANALVGAGVWKAAAPLPTPKGDVVDVVPVPNFRKVKRLAGALDLPTFIMPYKTYPSYSDFWRLVDLSGFETLYPMDLELDNPERTYIFVSPEGIPDCTGAKARCIFWQFEYQGDYTNQTNRLTCPEQWSSDPTDAAKHGARFVLLGSHPHLNPSLDRNPEPQWDLTLLGYMTDRRRKIKDQLSEYRWTPDYPGHDTDTRHAVLRGTRLMLHIHQHDTPALAPIRYALAAAYKLPVIAEETPHGGYPYGMLWKPYSEIVPTVKTHLQSGDLTIAGRDMGDNLYRLLCEQYPFESGVMAALESTPRTEPVKPKNKGGRPRKVKI